MLKAKFFALAFLASSFVFASENTTISDTKTFTKSIYPTRMTSTINLTSYAKNFALAKENLELINKSVKQNYEVCQVDSSQIQPKFIFENKKQKQDGYVTYTNINCEFMDVTEYDKSLSLIYQKSKELQFLINATPITWSVLESEQSKFIDDLKEKAIAYGLTHSKFLAKQLNSNCQIKSIKFQSQDDKPKFYPMMSKASADALTPTEPLDIKEQKLKLTAEYVWGCGY